MCTWIWFPRYDKHEPAEYVKSRMEEWKIEWKPDSSCRRLQQGKAGLAIHRKQVKDSARFARHKRERLKVVNGEDRSGRLSGPYKVFGVTRRYLNLEAPSGVSPPAGQMSPEGLTLR